MDASGIPFWLAVRLRDDGVGILVQILKFLRICVVANGTFMQTELGLDDPVCYERFLYMNDGDA